MGQEKRWRKRKWQKFGGFKSSAKRFAETLLKLSKSSATNSLEGTEIRFLEKEAVSQDTTFKKRYYFRGKKGEEGTMMSIVK
jgi:hypothetical protein